MDAVVIARELKKKLVELNKLEVTQPEVENDLFNLIVYYYINIFICLKNPFLEIT